MTNGQLANQSWYQSPSGAQDQIYVTVRWLRFCRCLSVKLLLAFSSTVFPGFSLLEIHDQGFCFLLDIYMFRNGVSSLTREASVFLCRHSKSNSHCDWRSVSLSWCRAPTGALDKMFLLLWKFVSCPVGAHDHMFLLLWKFVSCPCGGALSDERSGLSFVSHSW
jgi:hypothetical protein